MLTVDYQKPSYLPVHRQVKAPWQDYVFVDTLAMSPWTPG